MRKRSLEREMVLMCVKTFISSETFKVLRAFATDKQIPVSRLISIAIDNELDAKLPFNYPLVTPQIPYQEFQFAEEAGKLARYLERFGPRGVSVDTLVLCRRDFEVQDREKVLLALRELLAVHIVEEFKPKRSSFMPVSKGTYVRVIDSVKTKRGIA